MLSLAFDRSPSEITTNAPTQQHNSSQFDCHRPTTFVTSWIYVVVGS